VEVRVRGRTCCGSREVRVKTGRSGRAIAVPELQSVVYKGGCRYSNKYDVGEL
jgi:hypothetical protein